MTYVERFIDFQCYFSPLSHQDQEPVFLFVQDLQNVDDMFDIAWFWAKDPKGLEHLSQADALSLGLRDPCLSKVGVKGHLGILREPRLSMYDDWDSYDEYCWNGMVELRILHEALGFAADSPDIPRFLDLPTASVEWDGMFKHTLFDF